jgi:O-antigen/teichoic acid export membrane protein
MSARGRKNDRIDLQNDVKIHSVKFNVVMNMILTTSSFLFPLITVPYVSRTLSTFGTGAVAFAQSVLSYFSLVALLGIPVYGVRECARVRDDRDALSKTVQELLTILMISSAIAYAIFLVAVFTVPKFRENMPLMLIFSSTIWLASCGVEWFYQAIEQYGYITIRSIVMKLIGLILMFTFVHDASDFRVYGVIVVAASYGSNILNVLRLRKFVHFSLKRKLELKKHFKSMAVFTISSVSSGMYSQADLILLGFFGTTSMVGLYQLVVKIKTLCTAAVNSAGNVMLPRLSYYEASDARDKTTQLIAKNLNFLTIIGLGLIGIITLCAKPIVLTLGGQAFLDSTIPLILISPALLFAAANGMLSQFLVATGRGKAYAGINFMGLILAIIYGFVLIPSFGIRGAAISVSACEFSVLIVRVAFIMDFMKCVWKYLDLGKIVITAVVAFAVSLLVSQMLGTLPSLTRLGILVVIFSITYLVGLLLLKESLICALLRAKK